MNTFEIAHFDPELHDDIDDMYRDETVRRELIHYVPVTLDGVKATIGGVRNDYATVMALPNGAKYDWSWPAVGRIVSNGGNFHS